jgi:hypothetical protein
MNNLKCHYLEVFRDHGIVFLTDCDDGAMSITNNADEVYAHYKKIYPTIRIVYQGTDNVWMEIVENETWMGKGIGFAEWHGMTWDLLKRETYE